MKRLILASSLAAGCVSDPTPPVISDLTIEPRRIPVGSTTIIRGKVNFVDDDGIGTRWGHLQLIYPEGSGVGVQLPEDSSASDATAGIITWSYDVTPTIAGNFVARLRIETEEGQKSNELWAAFRAE